MSEPDYVLISGKRFTIDELDAQAHGFFHSGYATNTELGLAAVILALIDDRRRGHLPSLDEMRKVVEETRRMENLDFSKEEQG